MSRYLVTGGSGRLGRSVVQVLLDAGHEVVSVDRDEHESPATRQVVLDLTDAEATKRIFAQIRPDGVVHLAAIAVPFSLPDEEIFSINTTLAWSVLQATLAAEVPALLVASSPTVIGYGSPAGWRPQTLPIDESHPRAPWNGYSLSKVAVEELVAMAARRYGDRVDLGIFRPCYVITPEEWAGAPTQQGHSVAERLTDPELSAVALFNYVDARDAGDFVRLWLEQHGRIPNGSVFFVGAADSLVRAPVAEALRRHVPAVGTAGDALRGGAPVFSSALAERLLGWRASRSWRTELVDTARSDSWIFTTEPAGSAAATPNEVEHA